MLPPNHREVISELPCWYVTECRVIGRAPDIRIVADRNTARVRACAVGEVRKDTGEAGGVDDGLRYRNAALIGGCPQPAKPEIVDAPRPEVKRVGNHPASLGLNKGVVSQRNGESPEISGVVVRERHAPEDLPVTAQILVDLVSLLVHVGRKGDQLLEVVPLANRRITVRAG